MNTTEQVADVRSRMHAMILLRQLEAGTSYAATVDGLIRSITVRMPYVESATDQQHLLDLRNHLRTIREEGWNG